MSSRDHILHALRRARPDETPLPDVPAFPTPEGDGVAHFTSMIQQIGGQVLEATSADVAGVLATRYPDASPVVSTTAAYEQDARSITDSTDPQELAQVDLFVCAGTLGVAENGAVWLPESHLVHRAAPFLTQHLAIVLQKEQIVWTMHEAYARLAVEEEGFGLFVAGPSKTADIEQALVMGAHGPRSLTVVLTTDR